MKKLLRAIAIAVLGVSMSAGVAAAQTNITNGTGGESTNIVSFDNDLSVTVDNTNNVDLTVDNDQAATSGDVKANENADAGSVSTGRAHNNADVSADVTVSNDNGLCSCLLSNLGGSSDVNATIRNGTGGESYNSISSTNDTTVTVTNENTVNSTVTNTQTATSGNATANENAKVGNVTTGGASNSFSSDTSVHISN